MNLVKESDLDLHLHYDYKFNSNNHQWKVKSKTKQKLLNGHRTCIMDLIPMDNGQSPTQDKSPLWSKRDKTPWPSFFLLHPRDAQWYHIWGFIQEGYCMRVTVEWLLFLQIFVVQSSTVTWYTIISSYHCPVLNTFGYNML